MKATCTHVRPEAWLMRIFWTVALSWLAVMSVKAQTVQTDQPDYYPGEYVVITGEGWQPGEIVKLVISHSTVSLGEDVLYAQANAAGEIRNAEYLILPIHLGEAFLLTATGLSSGLTASTTFTDAPLLIGATVTNQQPPGPFCAGYPLDIRYTVSFQRNQPSNVSPGGLGQRRFIVALCFRGPLPAGFQAQFFRTDDVTFSNPIDTIQFPQINQGSDFEEWRSIVLRITGTQATNTAYNAGFTVDGVVTATFSGGNENATGFDCSNTNGADMATATGPNIVIRPRPTGSISIDGGTLVCAGDETELKLTVTGTGPWSGTLSDGTAFTGNSSPISVFVSPDVKTTYTIATLTDATGCSALSSDLSGSVTLEIAVPDINCPEPDAFYPTDEGTCSAELSFEATSDDEDTPEFKYYIRYGTPQQQEISFPYSFLKGTTTVTVYAENACGSNTCSFDVVVKDTEDPTFTVPDNITIEADANCDYDASVSVTGDVTDEDDNCDEGLQATFEDVVVDGDCQGKKIITRTWTLEDLSGNKVTKQQTITVVDKLAPTFTAPADITIYKDENCDYDASTSVTGDVVNENDNCSTGLQATYSDQVTAGNCEGELIITRTWSLTDNCGNKAADQTQIITVKDNTAPTFTAPADITIYKDENCDYDASISVTGDVTDEKDNCSTGLQATYSDKVDPGSCEGELIITRTWSLTDNCGNKAADQTQIITVKDNIKPTFTVPANITIELDPDCTYNADPSVTGDVTDEADNCTTSLDATYSDEVENLPGKKIITRTWRLEDDCGNVTTKDQIITVVGSPTTLTYEGVYEGQYSDKVTLTATLLDKNGQPVAGKTIRFEIGTQSTTAVTNASGVATGEITLNQDPDPTNNFDDTKSGGLYYTVKAIFEGDDCFAESMDQADFDIKREDARVLYTGQLFYTSANTKAKDCNVVLSATIFDITAVPGDPATDSWPGDISKAKVRFVIVETGEVINANVGLVNVGDKTIGTASATTKLAVDNSYTIRILVGDYYYRDSHEDDQVINIWSGTADMITGGGYIIVTDKAGGQKVPDVGSKNNFGFNVKFNKRGTSLQGHINTIIRRTETGRWDDDNDGVLDAEEDYTMVRVYQVKGNAMTSLETTGSGVASPTNPRHATYFGKASISDVTGVVAVPIQGNTTLSMSITDKGEPGTADEIALIVWNKDGGVWYVANWNGSQSQKQVLAGGNVVVHTGGAAAKAARSLEDATDGGLQLTIANNPAVGGTAFRLQVRSSDTQTPITIRMLNSNGQPVEMQRNLRSGHTLEFGRSYTAGMYIVEALQGDQRQVIKVLKQ